MPDLSNAVSVDLVEDVNPDDLTSYSFHPDLAPQIKSGEKTATVRYDDERELAAGDLLEAVNADTGERVALLVATAVTESPVKHIPSYFESLGAAYPHTTPGEICEALSVHYDATFSPKTSVRGIVFDRVIVGGDSGAADAGE